MSLLTKLSQRQKIEIDDADEEAPWSVTQAVAGRGDPNEELSDGGTLLMWAACHKSKKAASRLLQLGADINRPSRRSGATPLVMAAETGSTDMLQLLLDAGAKIDARLTQKPHGGRTALHIAAGKGHVDAVRLLIAHGGVVNDAEAVSTPLLDAAAHRHLAVMQVLLEAGADPRMSRHDGGVDALMMLFSLEQPMAGVYYALDEEQVLQGVEMLLKAGAEPNHRDDAGATALMAAGRSNLAKVCRVLLDAGADPTIADKDGDTAAAWATMNGHDELARTLRAAEDAKPRS